MRNGPGKAAGADRQPRPARRAVVGIALAAAVVGCRTAPPVLKYLGDPKPAVSKTDQLDVAYPLCTEVDSTKPLSSEQPRTILRAERDAIWDLTLEEALETALRNSDVIRTSTGGRGQVTGFGLTGSFVNFSAVPNANSPTIYDPALQATTAIGQRGVEAALSDFDTNFTSSLTWGKDERILNNAIFAGVLGGGITEIGEETAQFNAAFTKNFATGGSFAVGQNWNYDANDAFPMGQLFPSVYTGAFTLDARQPLLAGGGVEYTRIAGPIGPQFTPVASVNNGVVIARINEDVSVADFEIAARNLIKSVEDTYWNLYLAYRNYETSIQTRDSALRTWREAKAKLEIGGTRGFRPADEAQARDFYFETRAATENSLATLYTTEAELRRLMALPVNDGRVIRPIDEPTTAEFVPDWETSITEGLMYRTELRRGKWQLKGLQLQLRAARNLTQPRLDAVANYRVNAFGDRLIDYDENGPLDSAYSTLLRNDQTGWSLGLELSVPIGHRAAKAQVRNLELAIVRARELIEAGELDLTHEIADAMQSVATQYQTATSNFNRRIAAQRRLALFEEEFRASTVTLDEVLRAQASLAQAESAYFGSLVSYNQAVTQLQFAKGTLLEWNNISLAESPWTPAGYRNALRRAWERGHAIPNPMLHDSIEPFAIPDDSRRLVTPVAGEVVVPAEPIELVPLPTLPNGDAGGRDGKDAIPPGLLTPPEDEEAVPTDAPAYEPSSPAPAPPVVPADELAAGPGIDALPSRSAAVPAAPVAPAAATDDLLDRLSREITAFNLSAGPDPGPVAAVHEAVPAAPAAPAAPAVRPAAGQRPVGRGVLAPAARVETAPRPAAEPAGPSNWAPRGDSAPRAEPRHSVPLWQSR